MNELQIYLGVGLAGVVSFLSPCVLPLVPPYLTFLGGTTLEQMAGDKGAMAPEAYRRAVRAALFFVLGFTTVFVALGASASFAGHFIQTWRAELAIAAGLVIIAFGLHFLGLLKIPMLYREARYHVARAPTGPIGAYAIGLAFAFGWTPCIGPILAAVLTTAASEASLGRGVSLLFVYSMGLGIPFMLAALAMRPFLGFMQRFRRHLGTLEKVMGAALVITGLLFLTGSINAFGTWLLETFPAIGQIESWAVPESVRDAILKKGN
jgi:cytochrome c-type biogenesis protein